MGFPPGLVGGHVLFDDDVFAAGHQNGTGFGVLRLGDVFLIGVDDVHLRKIRSFGECGAKFRSFPPGGRSDLSPLLSSYDCVAAGIVPDVEPAVVAAGKMHGDVVVVLGAASDDYFETVA